MKQKLKDFFSEKKELFLFLGVLVAVFGMILTIATLTPKSDAPVNNTVEPTETLPPNTETPKTDNKKVLETMCLPINGEYTVVRYYFDSEDKETMVKSVIFNGETYIESKGVSYQAVDGKAFECLAVLSGTVSEVIEDSTNGTTVTITHVNDLKSTYYSLRNVNVKVGDVVTQGQKLGVSGISALDPEAGVHVHLEVTKEGSYINPLKAFGKKTSEITLDVGKTK